MTLAQSRMLGRRHRVPQVAKTSSNGPGASWGASSTPSLDEGGLEPGRLGETARDIEGRGREVESGHDGVTPR
jgi:hypothetical protein